MDEPLKTQEKSQAEKEAVRAVTEAKKEPSLCGDLAELVENFSD